MSVCGGEKTASRRVDDEEIIAKVGVFVEQFFEDIGCIACVEIDLRFESIVSCVFACVFDGLFFDIDSDGFMPMDGEAECDRSRAAVEVENGCFGRHVTFGV